MKGENAEKVINMSVISSRSLTNVKAPIIKLHSDPQNEAVDNAEEIFEQVKQELKSDSDDSGESD